MGPCSSVIGTYFLNHQSLIQKALTMTKVPSILSETETLRLYKPLILWEPRLLHGRDEDSLLLYPVFQAPCVFSQTWRGEYFVSLSGISSCVTLYLAPLFWSKDPCICFVPLPSCLMFVCLFVCLLLCLCGITGKWVWGISSCIHFGSGLLWLLRVFRTSIWVLRLFKCSFKLS